MVTSVQRRTCQAENQVTSSESLASPVLQSICSPDFVFEYLGFSVEPWLSCLCLLSVGIKGVRLHAQFALLFFTSHPFIQVAFPILRALMHG